MVNSASTFKFAQQFSTGEFAAVCDLPSVYERHRRWKPGREARCCAFSKNNKRFAWSNGHGTIKIVRLSHVKTSNEARSDIIIDCGNEVMSMEFAPEFKCEFDSTSLLAVGLKGGNIKIWNVDSGILAYNLSDHTDSVTGLTFAPRGIPILISCSVDKTLKVWDLEDDGNMTLTIKGHSQPILECAFSPTDMHTVASVGQEKSVFIWNFVHKRLCNVARKLRGHNNDVVSCSWSPDGALLATASHDTTVIIWDPYLNEQIIVLGHLYPLPSPIFAGGSNGAWVNSVSFSKDGTKLATVCEDNRFRVWKLWDSYAPLLETTLTNSGFQCRFSPDGQIVAVGKQNGSVTMALEAENEVLSLKHICRMAARTAIPSHKINSLLLPQPIKNYLSYRSSLD